MNAEIEDYFKSFTIKTETLDGLDDNVHVVIPTMPRPTASLPSKMVKKYISNSTREEATHTEECNKYCKFCVKLYYKFLDGDFVKQKNCYLLLEFCENRSLNNYLCKKSLITTLFQFRNLAETLYSMHDHNLFHRDIKPGNIFITKGNIYKIGDFDASRNTTSESTQSESTVKGTSFFLPIKYRDLLQKRVKLGTGILTYTDLFAFGKTLIRCFIGDDDKSNILEGQKLIEKIVESIYDQNIINENSIQGNHNFFNENVIQDPNYHRVFIENIRGFSEFLLSLINEDGFGFCKNFGDVVKNLEFWLGKFLNYQQPYFCYICSCSVYDMDFVVPCSESCRHCFHVKCFKDYLACDTESNKCPLCGVEGDLRAIRELFIRVLAKENKVIKR